MGLRDGVRGHDGGPHRGARASMEPVRSDGAGAAHAVPETLATSEAIRTFHTAAIRVLLGLSWPTSCVDTVHWPFDKGTAHISGRLACRGRLKCFVLRR